MVTITSFTALKAVRFCCTVLLRALLPTQTRHCFETKYICWYYKHKLVLWRGLKCQLKGSSYSTWTISAIRLTVWAPIDNLKHPLLNFSWFVYFYDIVETQEKMKRLLRTCRWVKRKNKFGRVVNNDYFKYNKIY